MDSDYSSDEEQIAEFLEWRRRPYTVRPRVDYFYNLDETDFFVRFRLPKSTVLQVLVLIEEEIETATDRNHSIAPIFKLLLTLRFYALGTMLISVADFTGVSKISACLIVRQVSLALARLAPQFIKMTTAEAEIANAQIAYYEKCDLPRVIGLMDCTHIKIQSPGGNHAENFRNRKGYFSLNAQSINDLDLKFLNVVARWPGSVHDQTIFNKSRIKIVCRVGSSGTALSWRIVGTQIPVVITRFAETPTLAHQFYNEAVVRTRNPVERSYGVWKRRSPVLCLGLRLNLKTTETIILATAVLHNIAIDQNCRLPPDNPEAPYVARTPWETLAPLQNNTDNNARDQILVEHFANL